MKSIVLVEDNPHTIKTLSRYLRRLKYNVIHFGDGMQARDFIVAHEDQYSLIILDLMLPRKNGLSIIEDARKAGITHPILMLTQIGDIQIVVKALETGADDYLTKPFILRELSARIGSLLRRPNINRIREIKTKSITVNITMKSVQYLGKQVDLTYKQFLLLQLLVENKGQTLSRDYIMEQLWDEDDMPFPNTVDVHIRMIRKALAKVNPNKIIHTIHGVGYKLVD